MYRATCFDGSGPVRQPFLNGCQTVLNRCSSYSPFRKVNDGSHFCAEASVEGRDPRSDRLGCDGLSISKVCARGAVNLPGIVLDLTDEDSPIDEISRTEAQPEELAEISER